MKHILNLYNVIKEFPAIGHSDNGSISIVVDDNNGAATLEWRSQHGQPVKLNLTDAHIAQIRSFLYIKLGAQI